MHLQSCCFADINYCFFDVLVAVAVVVAQLPKLPSVVTQRYGCEGD